MSYSQNGEDLVALANFRADYQGSILEVGCWFPTEFSNSRLFIEAGWEAVLVDLSPLAIDRQIRFHAGNPKVKVLCAAVAPCDQHIKEFAITEDALSSSQPGTEARWKGMRPDYDGGFYGKLWVPTLPIAKIYEQFYGYRQPDIVSIDVEGGSVELCVELINSGVCPRVMIVEHDNRSVELANFVEANGYAVKKHGGAENLVLVRI